MCLFQSPLVPGATRHWCGFESPWWWEVPPSVSRRPGAPKRVKPLRGCPQMQHCRCWRCTLQLPSLDRCVGRSLPWRVFTSQCQSILIRPHQNHCLDPPHPPAYDLGRLLHRTARLLHKQWLWWRRRVPPPSPVHVWLIRYTPISDFLDEKGIFVPVSMFINLTEVRFSVNMEIDEESRIFNGSELRRSSFQPAPSPAASQDQAHPRPTSSRLRGLATSPPDWRCLR